MTRHLGSSLECCLRKFLVVSFSVYMFLLLLKELCHGIFIHVSDLTKLLSHWRKPPRCVEMRHVGRENFYVHTTARHPTWEPKQCLFVFSNQVQPRASNSARTLTTANNFLLRVLQDWIVMLFMIKQCKVASAHCPFANGRYHNSGFFHCQYF